MPARYLMMRQSSVVSTLTDTDNPKLLTNGSFSGVISIDLILTTYVGRFRAYHIIFSELVFTADELLYVQFSTNGGSSFDGGAGAYSYSIGGTAAFSNATSSTLGEVSTSAIDIFGDAASGAEIEMILSSPENTARWTQLYGHCAYLLNSGSSNTQTSFSTARRAAQDTDALHFQTFNATNFSGKYAIYGWQ